VDDVNDFHLICITDGRVDNRVLRLGSGKNYSLVEILSSAQKILGTKLEPIHKPRMKDDPPVVTLANIADTKSLGWSPKISLEDGIRSMVPYIKGEMEKGNVK
jgi:UDP-glucose 4-epimerase